MLEMLAGLVVQHPARLAAMGIVLWVAWRSTTRPNPLWVAATLWLAYAGWEWLVKVRSPEANIRVDLLLIWPIVGGVTLWALIVVLKRRVNPCARR